MIYVFDNLNKIGDEEYQRLFRQLPPSRKQKAAILDGNNQKIAIAEYFALKQLLNLQENVDFCYNENGKPLLDGFNFSFSHCDTLFCIAVDKKPVGVDVEKQRQYDEKLAKYVLNKEELEFVEKQPNKDEAFAKLWVQKEATIKCLGLSLKTPLNYIVDTKRFNYEFQKYKDYCICKCSIK